MPARRGSVYTCQSGKGQPGGVSMLLTPGGWRSNTGLAVDQGGAVWHPPPDGAVQRRRGGAEPLAALAASLFGLSPDS